IEEAARLIAAPILLHQIEQTDPARRGDAFPERPQLVDAGFRRIAGDQGRIDRADRNAGDPVGLKLGFRESLVDPSLISSERAAALEHQGNALERRAWQSHVRLGHPRLLVHGNSVARATQKTYAGAAVGSGLLAVFAALRAMRHSSNRRTTT